MMMETYNLNLKKRAAGTCEEYNKGKLWESGGFLCEVKSRALWVVGLRAWVILLLFRGGLTLVLASGTQKIESWQVLFALGRRGVHSAGEYKLPGIFLVPGFEPRQVSYHLPLGSIGHLRRSIKNGTYLSIQQRLKNPHDLHCSNTRLSKFNMNVLNSPFI